MRRCLFSLGTKTRPRMMLVVAFHRDAVTHRGILAGMTVVIETPESVSSGAISVHHDQAEELP